MPWPCAAHGRTRSNSRLTPETLDTHDAAGASHGFLRSYTGRARGARGAVANGIARVKSCTQIARRGTSCPQRKVSPDLPWTDRARETGRVTRPRKTSRQRSSCAQTRQSTIPPCPAKTKSKCQPITKHPEPSITQHTTHSQPASPSKDTLIPCHHKWQKKHTTAIKGLYHFERVSPVAAVTNSHPANARFLTSKRLQ